MFFHKADPSKSPSISILIRSGSVDTYLLTPEGTVAYHCRVELPYQKEINLERYRKSMLAALLDSSMRLSTEGLAPWVAAKGHTGFSKVVVVLSAPWHQPFISRLTLANEKPFKVAPHVFNAAAEKEVQIRTEELTQALGEKVALLSESIGSYSINGYTTGNPHGTLATEAEAVLSGTAIGVETKGSISEVIGKVLQEDPQYQTSMQLLVSALSQTKTPERYLLIEAHGEITEASLVENGQVSDRETFPAGSHTLVRTLQKYTTMSAPEAQSAITLSKKGARMETDAVAQALEEARSGWQQSLVAALEKLSKVASPPASVILACDPEWEGWFSDAIVSASGAATQMGTKPTIELASVRLAKGKDPKQASTDYASTMVASLVDSRLGQSAQLKA